MNIQSLLFAILLLLGCSGGPEPAPEPTSNPSPIYMSSVPAVDTTKVVSQVMDSAPKTFLDHFEPIDWTNLHVFSPDGTSEDPLFKGRPIDSTFYHHFEINTYIKQFFTGYYHIHASYKIGLDKSHIGLIVRQMSQYNESSITLYVYDRQRSVITSYVELADSFGDGPWFFDENGWLIDLDGNGYPDLIKKKNEWWEEDNEDTNETTSHSSHTFTTFEFSDGTFIESELEIDEDRFKVKGWGYED